MALNAPRHLIITAAAEMTHAAARSIPLIFKFNDHKLRYDAASALALGENKILWAKQVCTLTIHFHYNMCYYNGSSK